LGELPLDQIDANPEEEIVRVTFSGSDEKPRPLLVVKQIITMLLAISQTELSHKNPELGDFVLDRERTGLSDRYQIYLVLFAGPMAWTIGGAGVGNVFTGRFDIVSEIAYPPFGYSMTIDSPPGALSAGNITPFVDVPANYVADIELDMLVGFGHHYGPLDFRSKAAVERDRKRNEGDETPPETFTLLP